MFPKKREIPLIHVFVSLIFVRQASLVIITFNLKLCCQCQQFFSALELMLILKNLQLFSSDRKKKVSSFIDADRSKKINLKKFWSMVKWQHSELSEGVDWVNWDEWKTLQTFGSHVEKRGFQAVDQVDHHYWWNRSPAILRGTNDVIFIWFNKRLWIELGDYGNLRHFWNVRSERSNIKVSGFIRKISRRESTKTDGSIASFFHY